MRSGFVTCVELGLSCIREVHDLGGSFDLFLSLTDEQARGKSGRVYLDEIARASGTPLVKIRHIASEEAIGAIRQAELDWLFIIGWSQIASREVLSAPRLGVIGMHPTLLPEGRGRASIPWAILKGLDRTGVTMFKLDDGIDTGPIIDQVALPIGPAEDATSLYGRIAEAHRTLMRQAWPALQSGAIQLVDQDDERATEWPARTPQDGQIYPTMTIAEVDRLVRATTRPYPGAFVVNGDGSTLRAWRGEPGSLGEGQMTLEQIDGPYTILEADHVEANVR